MKIRNVQELLSIALDLNIDNINLILEVEKYLFSNKRNRYHSKNKKRSSSDKRNLRGKVIKKLPSHIKIRPNSSKEKPIENFPQREFG